MNILIGKTYRFKSGPSSLKEELKGKIFKILTRSTMEVYNQDGSLVLNGDGQPFFMYHNGRSVLKHIDFSYVGIEPITHLKKFSLS